MINAVWWVQIEAIRSDLNEYMSIHGRMDGSQKWIWRSPDEFWCKLQPIYPSLNGSKAQRRWTWINVIATTIRLDRHLYEVISGCWPWAAQRREKFWQLLIPKCAPSFNMFQLTIARQTGLQVASASSCGRKVLHGEVEEILPGSVHTIWVPKADLQQPAHKHAHCVPHLSQKLEVWYGFAWYVQAMQPTSANALPRTVWSGWDSGAVRWIISRAANWPWPFAVRCRWTTFVPPWKVRRDGNTSPVAMEETVG